MSRVGEEVSENRVVVEGERGGAGGQKTRPREGGEQVLAAWDGEGRDERDKMGALRQDRRVQETSPRAPYSLVESKERML